MLHLLHPAVVHFPVAFLLGGGVCEAIGILTGREPLERFGGTLVVVGTITLLPTVITGFLAEFSLTIPEGTADAVSLHQRLGLATFALFLVTLFWKAWGGRHGCKKGEKLIKDQRRNAHVRAGRGSP